MEEKNAKKIQLWTRYELEKIYIFLSFFFFYIIEHRSEETSKHFHCMLRHPWAITKVHTRTKHNIIYRKIRLSVHFHDDLLEKRASHSHLTLCVGGYFLKTKVWVLRAFALKIQTETLNSMINFNYCLLSGLSWFMKYILWYRIPVVMAFTVTDAMAATYKCKSEIESAGNPWVHWPWTHCQRTWRHLPQKYTLYQVPSTLYIYTHNIFKLAIEINAQYISHSHPSKFSKVHCNG